jgi:integrase
MPSGAAVIKREGVRGVTWYIKWRDADGRQVKRRLDPHEGPWNERKAQRALGVELERVERERWRKPTRETFAEFASEWRRIYLPSRNLKRSTLIDYANTLDRHAILFFGELPLDAIGPEHIERYVGAKLGDGLSAKTVRNQLATLRLVFAAARRWKRIRENPLDHVNGPKLDEPETTILTEAEIAALFKAFRQLAFDAAPQEGVRFDVVRRMVVVALGTAVRRGELLALKWQDVEMVQRRLHVRRSLWRGIETTPKSKAGRRTIGFGLKTAAAFEEQWRVSRYNDEGDIVFGHPDLGTPLDPGKVHRCYLKPAMAKAGITKPGAWHVLRHTSLTVDAAVGNPGAYVQAKAGHSRLSTTERYIHAAQVAFPGAVERSEKRLFRDLVSE